MSVHGSRTCQSSYQLLYVCGVDDAGVRKGKSSWGGATDDLRIAKDNDGSSEDFELANDFEYPLMLLAKL